MNYFDYLKKRATLYVLCGAIAGIALCSAVLLSRYNSHLEGLLESMNSLSANKARVKKEIETIDSLTTHFQDTYGVAIETINVDSLLFQALDDMKSSLSEATISVSSVKRDGEFRKLPVTIQATMKSFAMILDYIAYIETRRMPGYRITSVTISREQREMISLTITGVFVIPLLGTEA
jgi:hypothetical protein